MKKSPFDTPLESAYLLPDFDEWFTQKWEDAIGFQGSILTSVIFLVAAIILAIFVYRWLFNQGWFVGFMSKMQDIGEKSLLSQTYIARLIWYVIIFALYCMPLLLCHKAVCFAYYAPVYLFLKLSFWKFSVVMAVILLILGFPVLLRSKERIGMNNNNATK